MGCELFSENEVKIIIILQVYPILLISEFVLFSALIILLPQFVL